VARLLVEVIDDAGDVRVADKMLADQALSRETLSDVDRYVSIRFMNALWSCAYEVWNNEESIGLRVARAVRPGDFGALEYLLRYDDTLQTALSQFIRYQAAFQRAAARWHLISAGDYVRLEHRFLGLSFLVHRFVSDFVLATLCRCLRDAGDSVVPRRVFLRRQKPLICEDYLTAFGRMPTFSSSRNGLEYSKEALEQCCKAKEASLAEILRRNLQKDVADQNLEMHVVKDQLRTQQPGQLTPTSDNVLNVFFQEGSVLKISVVSKHLGTSARTLRRKLRDENTQYSSIVDTFRLAQAKAYLENPALAIKEIAFLLDFSDVSAFYRAFRRWTGHPVKAYRDGLMSNK